MLLERSAPLAPAFSLFAWQGLEERLCDLGPAAHGSEPARWTLGSQARHGSGPTRADDLFAAFRALNEPGQLRLGRMNGMWLLHSRILTAS
jgi:hypothetical protein